jgi:hypothetical protein
LNFTLWGFHFTLTAMLRNDYTFTKRHLGMVMLAGGILAVIGLLAIDIVDVGRQGGIGPAQRIALVISALTALIGITLIPLGDKPA